MAVRSVGACVCAVLLVCVSGYTTPRVPGSVAVLDPPPKRMSASTPPPFPCPDRKHFLPTDAPRRQMTLLYSFPGSGNTWTRQLIESATGLYTGTMYKDNFLRKDGFMGENVKDPALVRVLKSHYDKVRKMHTVGPKWMARVPVDRMLFLIRNPFDAFIAERKRLITEIQIDIASKEGNGTISVSAHVGTPPYNIFQNGIVGWISDWDSQIATFVKNYLRTHMFFTFTVRGELQRGNKNTTAVIHFEKLKADPEGAMRGVLGFMGFDPASAACIQPELSPLAAEAKRQQVHRPKPKDYPECVYTPEQINYISSKMWSLLSEHGYRPPQACIDKYNWKPPVETQRKKGSPPPASAARKKKKVSRWSYRRPRQPRAV